MRRASYGDGNYDITATAAYVSQIDLDMHRWQSGMAECLRFASPLSATTLVRTQISIDPLTSYCQGHLYLLRLCLWAHGSETVSVGALRSYVLLCSYMQSSYGPGVRGITLRDLRLDATCPSYRALKVCSDLVHIIVNQRILFLAWMQCVRPSDAMCCHALLGFMLRYGLHGTVVLVRSYVLLRTRALGPPRMDVSGDIMGAHQYVSDLLVPECGLGACGVASVLALASVAVSL